MARKTLSHAERGRLGGLATLRRYGPEHFSHIGKRGFRATAKKYFDGDSEAMTNWLRQKGWAAQADAVMPGWGELLDPGPWPESVEPWPVEPLPVEELTF